MYNVSILNQTRPPDPLIEFLHNFEGPDGTFPTSPDETGKSVVVQGSDTPNAVSTTSPLFGVSSLIADKPDGFALIRSRSSRFDLSGTVEFCIETYANVTVNSAAVIYPLFGTDGTIRVQCRVEDFFGNVRFNLRLGALSGNIDAASTTNKTSGVTYHLALLRIADTIFLTADGVVQAFIPSVGSLLPFAGNTDFEMNCRAGSSGTSKLDSTRFTKGSSVYGAVPFTPQAGPLGGVLP